MTGTDDPFDTAGLRAAVLDGWARSPARFREDANAEESLALGGYAGRVLVELVANAVDAAVEAGVPPRVRVTLHPAAPAATGVRGAGESDGESESESDGDGVVELRVADNGTGLTATAVAGLASLRASGKRDTAATVGHFGVGFTAVLSVSDRPRVVSATGSVAFDPRRTAAAVADRAVPGLRRELDRRSGAVPVLRLPWPAVDPEPPPPGYRTEVRLPLRSSARGDVERALTDPRTVDDLFWALTDLDELTIGTTVTRRRRDGDGTVTLLTAGADARRFRLVERTGSVDDALLADRPVEERARRRWWVRWVHPLPSVTADDPAPASLSGDPSGPTVPGSDDDWFLSAGVPDRPSEPDGHADRWVAATIGAPTPTDEPLSLPAALVGTFPVDDTRRRLAPGPLTDHLLDAAVEAYVELLALTDPTERWQLLPTAGFPVGPIDGRLREGIVAAAAAAPLLLTAAGDEVPADRACLLPGVTARAAALLAEALPGLLVPPPAAAVPALRALGVRTTDLSAASGALAGIDRPAEFWGELYRELDAGDRPDPEALADLPVPLLGEQGRTPRRAFGPRGLLLPPADAGDDALAALRRLAGVVTGLRVVDPDAVAPLLERLGARPATPSAVLADPAVADAVRQALDDPDGAVETFDAANGLGSALTRSVLDLVASGAAVPAALVGALPLTDVDGELARADELHLPGSLLAHVVHPDDLTPIHPRWSADYPPTVLTAVGVRDGFVVVELADPTRDPMPGGAALPDLDDWLDRQGGPPPAVSAVLDLDLVDEDRWPQALQLLAADPAVRSAVRPGPDGPSYPGWWLGEFAVLDGVPLRGYRLPTAADLDGLYDPLPVDVDAEFARGCGVLTGLDAAVQDPQDLLDRLADPDRRLDPGRVRPATEVLVARLLGDDRLDPPHEPLDGPSLRVPAGVRTLAGTVTDADDAVVLDDPWWAQVLPPDVLVPGGRDPRRTAEAWDLPTASEEYRATVATAPDPAAGGGHIAGGGQDVGRGPVAGGGPDAGSAPDAGGGPDDDVAADARLTRAAAAVGLREVDLAGIVRRPGLAVSVEDRPAVRVRWWGEGGASGRLWVDGSAEAAGRAAAWRAGRWTDRQMAVAAADESPLALLEAAVD